MINIDKWVEGYKVRCFDWPDGKNIYLNISYYKPGASIEKSPAAEKSFLIPKEEEYKIINFLSSIVLSLMQKR